MARKIMHATVRVKAGPEENLADGEFLGYASVFGNIDSYGDIVEPGAFAGTLKEWADSGQNLPVLWGHDMYDPFSNIGHVVEATEDDKGLLVRGLLDLENPKAAQVYRLLKSNRVGQMSFAYDILDATEQEDGYHLKALKLYEVSIVPIGANQETEILAVKARLDALMDGAKAGRTLSAKNLDLLRAAQDAIQTVIKAAEDAEEASEDEDQKGKGNEDHPRGKFPEDLGGKSAALALITNQLAMEGA